MAKKQTEWAKMVGYGKWLEEFLALRIENWDVKLLFREAIHTLDLEYNFSDNHTLFQCLDVLTKKELNWMTDEGFSLLFYDDDNVDRQTILSLMHLRKIRRCIYSLFNKFNQSNKPWHLTYCEIQGQYGEIAGNKEDALAQISKVSEIMSKDEANYKDNAPPLTPEEIDYLLNTGLIVYADTVSKLLGQIGETILITLDGYKKVKTLLKCDHDRVSPIVFAKDQDNLLFDVIAVRMFFEFLFLGGQDYYGFCEYCDKFYVAERKGRKKFCSDVCRTMNQRK